MKKIFFVLAIFLFTVLSTEMLYGQTENNKKIRFGIGVSLYNIESGDYMPVNNIYMSFNFANKIRLEPSFGFALSDEIKSK